MWMTKCPCKCNNFDQLYCSAGPASSAPNYSDFEPIQRPGRKRSFEVDICPCQGSDDPYTYQEPLEQNLSLKSCANTSCSKFRISRVKRSSEESDFSNNLCDFLNLNKSHDIFDLMPRSPQKIKPVQSVPPSKFHVDVIPFTCQSPPIAVNDLIQF